MSYCPGENIFITTRARNGTPTPGVKLVVSLVRTTKLTAYWGRTRNSHWWSWTLGEYAMPPNSMLDHGPTNPIVVQMPPVPCSFTPGENLHYDGGR